MVSFCTDKNTTCSHTEHPKILCTLGFFEWQNEENKIVPCIKQLKAVAGGQPTHLSPCGLLQILLFASPISAELSLTIFLTYIMHALSSHKCLLEKKMCFVCENML